MSCAKRYQVLPPCATLAGLRGSGQDTLHRAPAQGAVWGGRGGAAGHCCRCPPCPPPISPSSSRQQHPNFPLGDPLSPLSLHDCRHLYVASGAPNPGIQGLLQGWTCAHASSIEFTQNLYWSYWERGFLGR